MSAKAPSYTNIGCGLFSWRPYRELGLVLGGREVAHLWLVLLASKQARLVLPGLWTGGIASMAENAENLSHSETVAALDLLQERQLVEYDGTNRVLRFTELPDKCMRACNGNTLRRWFTSWNNVTECAVKDRHIPLLCWLHAPISEMKDTMRDIWRSTFGSLAASQSSSPVDKSGKKSGGFDRLQAKLPEQLELYAAVHESNGTVNGRDPDPVPDTVTLRGESERGANGSGQVIDLWSVACARMAQKLGPAAFALWVEPMLAQQDGDTIRLTAPHEYARQHFRSHYAPLLETELQSIAGRPMQIAI